MTLVKDHGYDVNVGSSIRSRSENKIGSLLKHVLICPFNKSTTTPRWEITTLSLSYI